jgi:hypothetical protein
MTKLNRAMRRSSDTPPEWVCNARTAHRELDEIPEPAHALIMKRCHCSECLAAEDPRLIVGSPQPTEAMTVEKLEAKGLVGMYTRKPEFYIPCNQCHKGIPVSDPAHVAAARSGESVVVHYECLPEEQRRDALVSPYVLVKAAEEEDDDTDSAESSSEDICGEDGDGAEEERLPGRVEEPEPGSDDGETVG